MAKIASFEVIPMDTLEIGLAQVRSNLNKGVDELADSIDKQGLLQPIVVCPGTKSGKYEILIGQRRFLAHKLLKMDTIWAAIMDERVSELEAKAISLTENLVREGLSTKDKIDVCTWLYRKYGGTIAHVAEETGLSASVVSDYVKYDRLHEGMKELVDSGEVEVKTALRAQDAAATGTTEGSLNISKAIHLAKEMSGMSGVNQVRVVEELQTNPDTGVNEIVERAKSGERLTQITVTLSPSIHRGIREYADEEDLTQDDAAVALIEEALSSLGLLRD